jgi:NADH-quinone oxidoreductase subunit L
VVTVPLLLLAIPSVVIGFMTIQPMLFGEFFRTPSTSTRNCTRPWRSLPKFHGPLAMALHAFSTAPFYLALSGAVIAWYMYLINPAVPAAIGRALKPIVTILENKYYLDWFNENVLARGARALGTGLWKGGDQGVIEGGVVNASWKLVGLVSGVVRRAQTGDLYHYALMMIVGVLLFMTYFVWLAK